MVENDLEFTNKIRTMIIESCEKDDNSINEQLEEIEEKIEYLDINSTTKEKLKKMCQEIKAEKNEYTKNYLFRLLQKEISD